MGRQLSEHFNEDEFRCKCCGRLPEGGMDSELIDKLELLRTAVGKPLYILSGYRCEKHNTDVGGAPRSQHLLGKAADVAAARIGVDTLARAAERAGFRGIGRYRKQGFVHVDVRPGKARWEGK
jgi:Uncharacterized protein conserved in bacteria